MKPLVEMEVVSDVKIVYHDQDTVQKVYMTRKISVVTKNI